MVNFYGRFIENLSSLLSPLYALLKKGCTWKWSADCQASFEEVKRKLADSPVLMHFDPQLPVVVEADASPYGIGACLSHVLPDESRRPVFFVSRALTSAERSYSQADKEGLAIVFGVRRLHQFVFGRHFILQTDQKPLVKIFGEHVGLSSTVAACLQRWALIWSRYDYHIEFIRGCDNVVADCLSRLPVPLSPAVASWFVTLIRMHIHAGSSPDWGTVRTGPLASLLTPSFFVLSRQCLKMGVLGVDVET